MLYFSHVPVDPNTVDPEQFERLKGFKERVRATALVETFGSSLGFRQKFANQLEMKIRDLQEAETSDQPPPLDLQFLSLKQKSWPAAISMTVEIMETLPENVQVSEELRPSVEKIASSNERKGQG